MNTLRFLRFCVVGSSGVIVDMGMLALLVHAIGLPPTLAKALACEMAIVNNFFWNDVWTFAGGSFQPARPRLERFARFNGVSLAGLALNVAVFHVQVALLDLNLYLANAIAILAVALFNYNLSRLWAWRSAA